jgi:hypothetical protein
MMAARLLTRLLRCRLSLVWNRKQYVVGHPLADRPPSVHDFRSCVREPLHETSYLRARAQASSPMAPPTTKGPPPGSRWCGRPFDSCSPCQTITSCGSGRGHGETLAVAPPGMHRDRRHMKWNCVLGGIRPMRPPRLHLWPGRMRGRREGSAIGLKQPCRRMGGNKM